MTRISLPTTISEFICLHENDFNFEEELSHNKGWYKAHMSLHEAIEQFGNEYATKIFYEFSVFVLGVTDVNPSDPVNSLRHYTILKYLFDIANNSVLYSVYGGYTEYSDFFDENDHLINDEFKTDIIRMFNLDRGRLAGKFSDKMLDKFAHFIYMNHTYTIDKDISTRGCGTLYFTGFVDYPTIQYEKVHEFILVNWMMNQG